MKWIKKFNESRFTEFDNILNDVKDMCIDFGDLGLDYKVMVKNYNAQEKIQAQIAIGGEIITKEIDNKKVYVKNPVNIKFYKYILIEITDTSYSQLKLLSVVSFEL